MSAAPLSAGLVSAAAVLDPTAGVPRPAWIAAGQARRLDPLAALVCACVDRLPGLTALPADTAVVLGTAWGNVESTLRMADGMREHGDAGSSPTAFISSVHHNPAGTLGELRGWHGPAQTISLGGLSGLTALRRALLAARHGLTTVVVAADLPNPWTARTVALAAGDCPWPVGGGAVALLVRPRGGEAESGWWVEEPEEPDVTCDAGGATAHEERLLAAEAGAVRHCAAAVRGAWWPTAALAAAPWTDDASFTVVERESGMALRMGFRRA